MAGTAEVCSHVVVALGAFVDAVDVGEDVPLWQVTQPELVVSS